ncbi:MAG: hypothetical protein IKP88_14655 [Lachnospiraceae bacterium]|nr:hypothetical protein [Lachnospiraceae bacterium]
MNDLPEHLQPEYIQKVFDINNAVMEVTLNCKEKCDCLECGNAECFMVFEEQAKLQGMTLSELMDSWKTQRDLDEKAAEAQTKRYEQYQRESEQREMISKIKKSESMERSLFDVAA